MNENQGKNLSVVIACGGTGGHLFPGIAVAQILKKKGYRVTLLISRKKVDAQATEQYGDLDFKTVEAVAMPKIPSIGMFKFFFLMWKTWRSCKAILKEVQADVVVGMGGFTSMPPVVIGKRMGLRTYVHDSNALPGKANRMTSRWCDNVLLGMEEACHYFDKGKSIVTGTPVRMELEKVLPREQAYEQLGFRPKGKLVLAMGGSQGARNLNTLTIEAAGECRDLCEFLVITGTSDYERVKEMCAGLDNVHLMAFCSCMGAAYSAADVVISRSGASSLTELAHIGKTSLLVPYPFAADDHQAHNARVFSSHKAARVCREESLTSETIVGFLKELLTDDKLLCEMESAAKRLDVPDAADRIVAVVENNNAPEKND